MAEMGGTLAATPEMAGTLAPVTVEVKDGLRLTNKAFARMLLGTNFVFIPCHAQTAQDGIWNVPNNYACTFCAQCTMYYNCI